MRVIAVIGLAAAALSVVTTSAQAQRTDDEWLERCRRGEYNDDRERHCLVRVERLRSSGSLSVSMRMSLNK